MANCPYRNFTKCPENNGEEGCQFWVSYKVNSENDETTAEGCAAVLTPILLIQNINNTAIVSNGVNKLMDVINAGRFERLRDCEAIRVQMLTLASGNQQLVVPNFEINPNPQEQPVSEGTPQESPAK